MTQPQQSDSPLSKIPRFLRPSERKLMEKTAQELEKAANSPYLLDAHERSQLRQASERARADIQKQTPPALSKTEEDRASKRVKALEEQIQKGMLSDEEMRRNPVGAVDQHLRWEKRAKPLIKEWKALQIALRPGIDQADSTDLCNVERLRMLSNPNRNYEDAQIPRTTLYSMPPRPEELGEKAGWPYRDPFGAILDDSPERAQAEAEATIQELQERLARLESKAEAEKVIEADVSTLEQKDLRQVDRKQVGKSDRRG